MDEKKEETNPAVENNKSQDVKGYEKLIDRLKDERNQLQKEMGKDYKDARRFVRAHPEEGVLLGLLSGITLGFLLGKILK